MREDCTETRKLVLQKECSIVRRMIDSDNLPGDLKYPVCFVYQSSASGEILVVADGDYRKWNFEL